MRVLATILSQETKVDVYENMYCKNTWGSKIKDFHICVGDKGNSGACRGDSGGPLACKVGGIWKLAGATSWGRGDCNVDSPAVYTRVSYYHQWIKKAVQELRGI